VEVPFVRPRLGLPFGALAFVGAWLVGDWYHLNPRLDHEMAARAAMLVLSPLTAFVVGMFAARAPTWRERIVIVVLGTPLGAMLVGMITAAVVSRPSSWETAVGRGAMEGVLVGACFLPALGLVMLAARRAERTRDGTLLHQAAQRGPVRAVMTALFAGALVVTLARGVEAAFVDAAIAGVLGFVTICVWARDLVALRQLAPDLARAAAAQPEHGDPLGNPRTVDLGVGEGERRDVRAAASAYRDVTRTATIFRGDLEVARRWTRTMMAEGAVALALGVALSAALALRPALARDVSANVSGALARGEVLKTFDAFDQAEKRALARAVPVGGASMRRTEGSYEVELLADRTCVSRTTAGKPGSAQRLFCAEVTAEHVHLLDAGSSILLEAGMFDKAPRHFFHHPGADTIEVYGLGEKLGAATINEAGILVAPAPEGVEVRSLRSGRSARVSVRDLYAIGGWIDDDHVLLVTHVHEGFQTSTLDVEAALRSR
jgi:hypothetical protein